MVERPSSLPLERKLAPSTVAASSSDVVIRETVTAEQVFGHCRRAIRKDLCKTRAPDQRVPGSPTSRAHHFVKSRTGGDWSCSNGDSLAHVPLIDQPSKFSCIAAQTADSVKEDPEFVELKVAVAPEVRETV